MLREPTAGSGKPRRGHKNIARQPGSRPRKKQAGGAEPGPPRGSLHGVARGLQAAQLHLQLQEAVLLPGCADGGHVLRARVVVLEGHERAHQSELGFEQQNRFRNPREIQRIENKAFRARADAARSARQGGTEPGTTRFRDGRRTRATSPAAGPRRAHGSAAAKRARPRKRAYLARGKYATFAPNLDLNNETDLEACGARAELKRKS